MSSGPVQQTIYVAPTGDDSNPGTVEQPLATLRAARDLVRTLNRNMTGHLVVELRGGCYRLSEPFVLGPQDSGTNGFDVIYRSAPGETAALDGGIPVSGWTETEGGRWTAAVDVPEMRQLYSDGHLARRAYGKMPWFLPDLELLPDGRGYRTANANAAQLIGVEGLELVYRNIWAHTRCGISEVRQVGAHYELLMRQPEFYLAQKKEGVQLNQPELMENVPQQIMQPGGWRYDAAHKTLTYRPKLGQDPAQSTFIVPVLETLLEIRGTPAEPVHNLKLQGLCFQHATWLEPNRTGFVDIQANFRVTPEVLLTVRPGFSWNGVVQYAPFRWDCIKSPANVICHAGYDIRFEECRFKNLGGAGLDIERGSCGVQVSGCEFTEISGSAIQVADVVTADHHPDDPRLGVSEVSITGCEIHHVAREYKGGVGVCVGYARDVHIAHNDFHHLPYSALSVGWGWGELDAGGGAYTCHPDALFDTPALASGHTIEANHIHDAMLELFDGGAIYTLGCMPGTVIRENLIHDCIGIPGGIYLDEGSADIRVERNVIYNVPWGLNLNNHPQGRSETTPLVDNVCDIAPGMPGFPEEIAARAGRRVADEGGPGA